MANIALMLLLFLLHTPALWDRGQLVTIPAQLRYTAHSVHTVIRFLIFLALRRTVRRCVLYVASLFFYVFKNEALLSRRLWVMLWCCVLPFSDLCEEEKNHNLCIICKQVSEFSWKKRSVALSDRAPSPAFLE